MRQYKGIFIIILLCCALFTKAQEFSIDRSADAKHDKFVINFLAVLNDAPSLFSHVKGKLLSTIDSVHLKSKIFQSKIYLPEASVSRYVEDSTYYMEFFFGEYDRKKDAAERLSELTTKVAEAMSKKVIILKNDYGNDQNTVLENKIGYAVQNGFFHYNVSLQVNKVLLRSTYRVVLQVFSGRPVYYNWITKNEPKGSFIFIDAVKKTYTFFTSDSLKAKTGKTCFNEIPTFKCKNTIVTNDTTLVTYYKTGYDNLLDAKTECDVIFTNLRSGLGSDYVYFSPSVHGSNIKRYAFVKYNDVDKPKRKTIFLTLIEKKADLDSPLGINGEYDIELSFAY